MNTSIVKKNISDACIDGFNALMAQYQDIVVLDLNTNKIASNLDFNNLFQGRYYNLGLGIQNALGMAIGFSMAGKTPIVCFDDNVSIAGEIDKYLEVINKNSLKINFVDLSSQNISISDLSNLAIVMPAGYTEAYASMKNLIGVNKNVYLKLFSNSNIDVFKSESYFNFGRGEILWQGNDICVLSSGDSTAEALEIINKLYLNKVSAMHVHMSTINPIDENVLETIANKVDKVIVVEDIVSSNILYKNVSMILGKYKDVQVYARLDEVSEVYEALTL